MKTGWHIAIMDASSLQGKALIQALKESDLDIASLYLLTNKEETTNNVRIKGMTIPFLPLQDFDWEKVQVLLLTEQADLAQLPTLRDKVVDAGCVIIDLTNNIQQDLNVPLFTPGVNNWVLDNYRETNIITLSNAVTSQLALTLSPLLNLMNINQLTVTNLLPVALCGEQGVSDLASQSARLLNGLPIEETVLFPAQIAFNVLPVDTLYTRANALFETIPSQLARVLEIDSLDITVQGAIVPVFYANTQFVSIDSHLLLSIEELQWRLSANPLFQLHDTQPNPLQTVEQAHQIHLGPLQYKHLNQHGIKFCSIVDSLNFGSALLAIQTLKLLGEIY